MKPIEFKGCNIVYGKDQPEYIPLPVHKTITGKLTSCWQLTFKEKMKLLFTGKVYLTILTFNQSLQPVKLSVDWKKVPEEITK